ncbi:hypothetical protein QVD17_12890 [Tagetes erecta]|uniref:GCK domain-containing protein n=1 Tax=Tagetes erecta TaxID=13708 RepID=A0AAD8P1U4_TARER|nr:hypothetical protein QVD17_12890 [Tagetes erecta]
MECVSTTSLDAKAREALDSPCLQKLKSGPCGSAFSTAFLCFLKSTSEEKGSDCVHSFKMLKKCIETNPDAYRTNVVERSEVKTHEEIKPTRGYRFPSYMVRDNKQLRRDRELVNMISKIHEEKQTQGYLLPPYMVSDDKQLKRKRDQFSKMFSTLFR